MPSTPSPIQSKNEPDTYRLRDGRTVEMRWGCLVDQVTRHTVAGSEEAYQFLCDHAVLTKNEREHLDDRQHAFNLSPAVEVINERKRQWKEGEAS